MIHEKITIIEAANQLGLGGTERALENFCRNFEKTIFDVKIVGFSCGGERADILKSLGFPVFVLNGDSGAWAELLKGADVLHWHHDGTLPPEVFEPLQRHKPPLVIQTNVFGLFDHSPYYDLIDLDLYISRMCLVRRNHEDGLLADGYRDKRATLYFPVDLDGLFQSMPSDLEVRNLRSSLGLGNFQVVGRVGRADDDKFHTVAIDMMRHLKRWVPEVKFLLVGPTDQIKKRVSRFGLEDAFVYLKPTPDLRTLLSYYRCMDVYLAASQIGESFGMVIAEAMACGLPVVSVSTPDADNAQIELVDNGRNGLVVEAYPRLVAMACRDLLLDDKLRRTMGRESGKKVMAYAAPGIVRALGYMICKRLGREKFDRAAPDLIMFYDAEMESEYSKRLTDLYARPGKMDKFQDSVRRYGGFLKRKMLNFAQDNLLTKS